MSIQVVGIGRAELHHLAVVERYPEPDSQVEMSSFSVQGGGTAATAMATLALLGAKTQLLGKLSDDSFGDLVRRPLAELGVDLSRMACEPGRLSPYRFIVVDGGGRHRTVFHTEGNLSALRRNEVTLDALEQAEMLVVDGHQIDAQIRAAEQARKVGTQVVLDAGTLVEGMGELMALSDVLIASERFASEVAPRGELEDSLLELHRMGPQTVVVTMGSEGSIGLEGDKLVRQPVLTVDVVDTTGAGDVYLGGFCYGMLQGWPLERRMQAASAAAGLSCRALGSMAGLPEPDDLSAVDWQEVHA